MKKEIATPAFGGLAMTEGDGIAKAFLWKVPQ
jgi:hypothetical protein